MPDDSVTPATRDFLTAIMAVLDVPVAARGEDASKAQALLKERTLMVRVVIGTLIDGTTTLGPATEIVRRELEKTPVTYEPDEQGPDA
ncbi:hypothetical protein AB0B07_33280 [Streptomyces sioyaensis]|uniref:hypothetical protein n=1 Tax=Streptomyces sioyaensis TaxID=67364 RepID=UPI0033D78F69